MLFGVPSVKYISIPIQSRWFTKYTSEELVGILECYIAKRTKAFEAVKLLLEERLSRKVKIRAPL